MSYQTFSLIDFNEYILNPIYNNEPTTNQTHSHIYLLKKEKQILGSKELVMYTQIMQTNRQTSQYGNFMIHTIPQMFSL